MTNAEFQEKLTKMREEHHLIAGGPKLTFNTLVWLLRNDDVDYNISIPPYKDGMGWLCVCSVKECFIPVKELAMHVQKVEVDECADDDFEYDGICLTVWLEE